MAFAADEWGHPARKSRVLTLWYRYKDVHHENFEVGPIKNGHAVEAKYPDQVVLHKGDDIEIYAEWEEVKRIDDMHHMVYAYPTINITIIVRAYEGMCITPYLEHRKADLIQSGPDHYTHSGVLLPKQAIIVRLYKS